MNCSEAREFAIYAKLHKVRYTLYEYNRKIEYTVTNILKPLPIVLKCRKYYKIKKRYD